MAAESIVSLGQLAAELRGLRIGRVILWLVVHHTWRPTAAQYRGISTVRGVRRYHVQVRGWSDNGYHIMVGADGTIFLCRPMARSGAHCIGRNADSIGVSLILDGDREQLWGTVQARALFSVLALLCARFRLDPRTDIGPHARWANKSCPGRLITARWAELIRSVIAAMSNEIRDPSRPKIVLLPGTTVIHCKAVVEKGVTRCDLRPLVEALGYRVHGEHLSDQAKIYLEEERRR